MVAATMEAEHCEDLCTFELTSKPPITPKTEDLAVTKSELYQIPLNLLNCSFGIVKLDIHQSTTLQRIVQERRKATGADITVVFAVRTPGCGLCREHGLQLTEWASKYVSTTKKRPTVSLVGIVKESGTAATDEAVLNFYEQYFKHPIYQDSKWQIYRAMGGRNLNIWSIVTNVGRLRQRWAAKKIVNQPQGEQWMQGGVLVFDRHGDLRHVMYDKFGELFDLNALDAVVYEIKRSKKKSSTNSTILMNDFSESVFSESNDFDLETSIREVRR